MSQQSPHIYSTREARGSHAMAAVVCIDCNNEILLMHAPRGAFRHWCLRCDEPTLHCNKGFVPKYVPPPPPKEQDDLTPDSRRRAYHREYSRRRRARNRAS